MTWLVVAAIAGASWLSYVVGSAVGASRMLRLLERIRTRPGDDGWCTSYDLMQDLGRWVYGYLRDLEEKGILERSEYFVDITPGIARGRYRLIRSRRLA